jgi:hypothetical protein
MAPVSPKVPVRREDGKCVQCQRPLPAGRRKEKGVVGQVPKDIWLVHLAREPFCSRACAEAFFGNSPTCEREGCGREFVPSGNSGRRQRYCSPACQKAVEQKQRRARLAAA